MAIPQNTEFMLPLLIMCRDNQVHTTKEACAYIRDIFNLSDEDINLRLPSGDHKVYKHRVTWALYRLKETGLIESLNRGSFQITTMGISFLEKNPEKINNTILRKLKECREP